MKPPRNPKRLGDQAECAFLWQALQRGFVVSKPVWGQESYDFIVEVPCSKPIRRRGQRAKVLRKIWRIQVKSTNTKYQCRYAISAHGGGRRPYRLGEFDFFAAWVIPLDTWYIIPAAEVLPVTVFALFPHVKGSWGRYEKFREAWHLLGAIHSRVVGVRGTPMSSCVAHSFRLSGRFVLNSEQEPEI